MLAIPQSKVSPIHSVVQGESLHPDSKEHLKLQKENKSQSLEQQPHPINRASSIYGSPSMTVAGMELKYKYKMLHKRKYYQKTIKSMLLLDVGLYIFRSQGT